MKLPILLLLSVLLSVSVLGVSVDDLNSYWSFDTDTSDDHGTTNAVNGGASHTDSGCLISGCYLFGADSGDQINTTIDPTITAINDFSFTGWFKLTESAADTDFLSYIQGADWQGVSIGWGGTNMGHYTALNGPDDWNGWNGWDTYNDGNYHFVVMTHDYSETNITYYIDGVTKATSTSAGPLFQKNTWILGNRYAASHTMPGYIDEVGYWSVPLSQADVLELYNGGDGLAYPFLAPALDFFNMTPANNTNINDSTMFYYNISGFTEPSSCSLFVNGVNKTTNGAVYNKLNNFTYQTAWGNEGTNTLMVHCGDGSTSYNNTKYMFQDTINPDIWYINVTEDGQSFTLNGSELHKEFTFDIKANDTNLYSFNITVTNSTGAVKWTDWEANIGGGTFAYSNTTGLGNYTQGDNHTFNISFCDSHTLNLIRDLPTRTIHDGVDIDGNSYRSDTSGMTEFRTEQLRDRVVFEVEYDEPRSTITLDLETRHDLVLVKNSRYMAHFVHGPYWTDFHNPDYQVDDIRKLTDNHYKITVSTRNRQAISVWSFSSTGIINCNNVTVTAFINADNVSIALNAPANDTLFSVNNATYYAEFNYTPSSKEYINNCSFYLESTLEGENLTISVDAINPFYYTLPVPGYLQSDYYKWHIMCEQDKVKNGGTDATVISDSGMFNFSVYNYATTTTTTTTTTVYDYSMDNPDTTNTLLAGTLDLLGSPLLLTLVCLMVIVLLMLAVRAGKAVLVMVMLPFIGSLVGAGASIYFSLPVSLYWLPIALFMVMGIIFAGVFIAFLR